MHGKHPLRSSDTDALKIWSNALLDEQSILQIPEPAYWIPMDDPLRTSLQKMSVASGSQMLSCMRLVLELWDESLERFKKIHNDGSLKYAVVDFRGDVPLAEMILKTPLVAPKIVRHAQHAVAWSGVKWAEALKANADIFKVLHLHIQSHPLCVNAALKNDCMNYQSLPKVLREQVALAKMALSAKSCGVSEFETIYPYLPAALKCDLKTIFEWQKKGWISKGRSERFLSPLHPRLKMIAKLKGFESAWEAFSFMQAKWERNDLSITISAHEDGNGAQSSIQGTKKLRRL